LLILKVSFHLVFFLFTYFLCFCIDICSSEVNLWIGGFSHPKSFWWIILNVLAVLDSSIDDDSTMMCCFSPLAWGFTSGLWRCRNVVGIFNCHPLCLLRRDLANFLPGLTLSYNLPSCCLNTWDYRCKPLYMDSLIYLNSFLCRVFAW
jgi:hypothetical protein